MLSRRGAEYVEKFRALPEWEKDKKQKQKARVDWSNASNYGMQDEMCRYLNEHCKISSPSLSYNEGFKGTERLQKAMSAFVNRTFHPVERVEPSHITFVGGVTALLSVASTLLVDAGDAVLLGRPAYGSFVADLTLENGGETRLEFARMAGLDDQFSAASVPRYEEAVLAARRERGRTVSVLLICNPHNPLGACYTPDALAGLMRLCEKYGMHLVSDELYANSVFDVGGEGGEAGTGKPGFTSVLAVDSAGLIDPQRLHVLYGMSKDFAAPGLRNGCLISRNRDLLNATVFVTRYHAPAEVCSDLVTQVLEDEVFVDRFLADSRRKLASQYRFATQLLDEAGIDYYRGGNAGFFVWADLSPFLDPSEPDKWQGERVLKEQLTKAGVLMSTGEAYKSESPGWFRVLFTTSEESVREGIKMFVHSRNSLDIRHAYSSVQHFRDLSQV